MFVNRGLSVVTAASARAIDTSTPYPAVLPFLLESRFTLPFALPDLQSTVNGKPFALLLGPAPHDEIAHESITGNNRLQLRPRACSSLFSQKAMPKRRRRVTRKELTCEVQRAPTDCTARYRASRRISTCTRHHQARYLGSPPNKVQDQVIQ